MLATIQVSDELRALTARSIDHVEQAFDLFFAAAGRCPKQSVLLLSQDNVRATLAYARAVIQISEPQEIVRTQAAYIKRLLTNAQQQMKHMSGEP